MTKRLRRELRWRFQNPSVARGLVEPPQFGTVITELVRVRGVALRVARPGVNAVRPAFSVSVELGLRLP